MLKKIWKEYLYTISYYLIFLIGIISISFVYIFQSSFNTLFGNYQFEFNSNNIIIFKNNSNTFRKFKSSLTFHGKFKKFAFVDSVSNILRFLAIVILFYFEMQVLKITYRTGTFFNIRTFWFVCLQKIFKISDISIKNIKEYLQNLN